jgi:predicted Zn-dependent protease
MYARALGIDSASVIYYTHNQMFEVSNRLVENKSVSQKYMVHSATNAPYISVISSAFMEKDMLMDRLIKVTLHEVGHLSGAVHCRNKRCVMNLPRDITDTTLHHLDEEMAFYLCDPCNAKIEAYTERLKTAEAW